LKIRINIKANGWMGKCMVKVGSNGKMDHFMKENISMVKNMELDDFFMENQRTYMRDIGKMGNSMEKEYYTIKIENK
jgi:hypothetical protein